MNKLSLTFILSSIAILLLDIFAIVFFAITLSNALSLSIVMSTSHIALLIFCIAFNVIYLAYLVTYLVIHKKR